MVAWSFATGCRIKKNLSGTHLLLLPSLVGHLSELLVSLEVRVSLLQRLLERRRTPGRALRVIYRKFHHFFLLRLHELFEI